MAFTDENFSGSESAELPVVDRDFSCKSDTPPIEPDVLIDVRQGDGWVRIPVVNLELWINRDGPADISRTAKCKFPAEWGGQNIRRSINGFDGQNPSGDQPAYDECRIFTRDQYDQNWQVVHYGYVGGVGPASEDGVFKFWVYDPADLVKGIQVSKSFGEPTIAEVLDFAVRGTDEQGRAVGIENRSVFDNVRTFVAGPQEVVEQKQDERNLGTDDDGRIEISVGPIQLDAKDLADDVYDQLAGTNGTNGILGGQKRFQVNRHNMADLLNWFAGEVNAKWHFEPTAFGPILFFDNREDEEVTHRYFADTKVVEQRDDGSTAGLAEQAADVFETFFVEKRIFDTVDTLHNEALVDIKPFNTLTLYGESATIRDRAVGSLGTGPDPEGVEQNYNESGSPGFYTEEYPYVKLTYDPLVERAGGYEYTAPAVESDKIYLEQAERHAIREFREHLSEQTEGSIVLKGAPHIVPFDRLLTIPVCDDTYPNADATPVLYEVNSVKHESGGGTDYTTELGISLAFDESELEITSEYRTA